MPRFWWGDTVELMGVFAQFFILSPFVNHFHCVQRFVVNLNILCNTVGMS